MEIRLVTDRDSFLKLESVWLELEEAAENNNYYRSWDWFRVYLDWFVNSGKTLLVAVLTAESRPAAIAPFAVSSSSARLFTDKSLEFLGAPFSPSFGALAAKGMETQAAEELSAFLLGPAAGMWDSFSSWGISPDETFSRALIRSLRERTLDFEGKGYTENYHLNLAAFPDDQNYYNSLSRSIRKKTIERGLKKLTELGDLKLIMVDPEATDFDLAFNHYEQIYAGSWKERPAETSFHREHARFCLKKGFLRLFLLYFRPTEKEAVPVSRAEFDHFDLPISNEVPNSEWTPIAVDFYLIYKKAVFGVKTAYRDDYRQFSPGIVLLRFLIKYLIEKDRADYIDFQTGKEDYKRSLGAVHSENRYYFCCANPRSTKKQAGSLIRRCSRGVGWINRIVSRKNK